MRRVRLVALTAAATILAMIPQSHSGFWAPMALTHHGGLSVATLMTLLPPPAI
jgi:multidrug efflux pump subunit AcrB